MSGAPIETLPPPGLAADASHRRQLGAGTLISVVVPCYNEEEVLPLLEERLSRVAATWDTPYEIILVDDGSVDRTWEILVGVHRRDPRWKVIRFARNFGHQTALRAGLCASQGDIVAVVDADLQDPPEILASFFAKWKEGYDVIYGVRRRRKEGWFLRAAYYSFYRVLSRLAEDDIPLDTGDFSVMDRRIVDLINRMPERKPFIRGLRSWVGFRQVAMPYDRQARAAGDPKYDLSRLVGLAVDGIFSSSIVPLRMATWSGLFISIIAFLGAIVTFLLRILPDFFARFGLQAVPGTASVIIVVLFLGGVQLISVGICGEYIGRIYENIKGRPFWTISDCVGVAEPIPNRAILSQLGAVNASTPSPPIEGE